MDAGERAYRQGLVLIGLIGGVIAAAANIGMMLVAGVTDEASIGRLEAGVGQDGSEPAPAQPE